MMSRIALSLVSLLIATATFADTTADFIKRYGKKELQRITKGLTPEQSEAITALYAYMPLPDATDYSTEFFVNNVNATLQAKAEMPWGSYTPKDIWLNFVVPIRVNNEVLDNHRILFFNELRNRVKGLSMADAILEVNHWCHEKVTYQPSDGRTHTPLQSVYTAIGRCGEESTFTVAALRSVGIPARQIYTPRWAHTDDNHAWVEAWADGQWYFLGACEPEAVLNRGWFNAPAARGMLMSTRVIGEYSGEEEVIRRTDMFTDINTTHIYAPVSNTRIRVIDPSGKEVEGAVVGFRLYNYAEFYPLARKITDKSGIADLTTGIGDMVIWAAKGDKFGFKKVKAGCDTITEVALIYDPKTTLTMDLDIVPPVARADNMIIEPQALAHNNCRLAYEDSIRTGYVKSRSMTPEQISACAKELGIDHDRLSKVLTDARTHSRVLAKFLTETKPAEREKALRLLEVISEKDRREVDTTILRKRLEMPIVDSPLYYEYILNPRVDIEALTDYQPQLSDRLSAEFKADPTKLVKWVSQKIDASARWEPGNVRMNPSTVLATHKTNAKSRDIFFVATARAIGIPARIDPVTEKVQWADAKAAWHDVDFEAKRHDNANAPQGKLRLEYEQSGRLVDPGYFYQFSISKISDGEPVQLNYPEDATTWKSTFAEGTDLDCGQYMLVSGQRLANGSVLSNINIFQIEPGVTTVVPLVMRHDDAQVQVIGSLNAEDLYFDNELQAAKSILSTTGRGYYVLGLVRAANEPTNHALRDIARIAKEFEDAGRSIILLTSGEDELSKFDHAALEGLPSNVTWGHDIEGAIAREIKENLLIESSEMPIFVIADTFNRVVFMTQGYSIGLGDRILDTLHKILE